MYPPPATIGIATAQYKPEVRENAILLCRALRANGRRVLVSRDMEKALKAAGCTGCEIVESPDLAGSDLIISLGGDGTLLEVAHYAAPRGTPLLGIDMGSFGFLAAVTFDILMMRLDQLLGGDYETESRMMVAARVMRHGRMMSEHIGLNEAVITKSDVRRLVRLFVKVSGEHLSTYPADGLIVSTPTGTTAYALSAGGPIVSPRVDALLIVPICPHTLYSRPVIVEPTAEVEISVVTRGRPVESLTLTLDGQDAIPLETGDIVSVTRAACDASLVRLSPMGFYERLRTKLQWGEEH